MIKFKLNIKPKAERVPKAGDVYSQGMHVTLEDDAALVTAIDGGIAYCMRSDWKPFLTPITELTNLLPESEIPERVKKVRVALFPDLVHEVAPYVPQRGDIYKKWDGIYLLAEKEHGANSSYYLVSSDGENWRFLSESFVCYAVRTSLIARATNLPEYGWPETVEAEEV